MDIHGNTQGCLIYSLSQFCLTGNNGFLVHRKTGNLITTGGSVFPEEYIKRENDILLAKDKSYVLYHEYANDKKMILKFKKLFRISLTETMTLLNSSPVLFTGEKTALLQFKAFLLKAGLNSKIELMDDIPNKIIKVDTMSYFDSEKIKVVQNHVSKTNK